MERESKLNDSEDGRRLPATGRLAADRVLSEGWICIGNRLAAPLRPLLRPLFRPPVDCSWLALVDVPSLGIN